MTFDKLYNMVKNIGVRSFDQIYVFDPKNKKKYTIKSMQGYSTEDESTRFGIIELEEE